MYKPRTTFTTPFMILNPVYRKELGKNIKEYDDEGEVIYVSFKSYGGTETIIDGVWAIKDTAEIETWYRPDINTDTRLQRLSDGKVYEIIADPENIEMRNQFLKFKVECVKGKHG